MTTEEVNALAMAAFLAARKLEGVTDAMAYDVKDAVVAAAEAMA